MSPLLNEASSVRLTWPRGKFTVAAGRVSLFVCVFSLWSPSRFRQQAGRKPFPLAQSLTAQCHNYTPACLHQSGRSRATWTSADRSKPAANLFSADDRRYFLGMFVFLKESPTFFPFGASLADTLSPFLSLFSPRSLVRFARSATRKAERTRWEGGGPNNPIAGRLLHPVRTLKTKFSLFRVNFVSVLFP